jgi:hypothetical protein
LIEACFEKRRKKKGGGTELHIAEAEWRGRVVTEAEAR